MYVIKVATVVASEEAAFNQLLSLLKLLLVISLSSCAAFWVM